MSAGVSFFVCFVRIPPPHHTTDAPDAPTRTPAHTHNSAWAHQHKHSHTHTHTNTHIKTPKHTQPNKKHTRTPRGRPRLSCARPLVSGESQCHVEAESRHASSMPRLSCTRPLVSGESRSQVETESRHASRQASHLVHTPASVW